MLSSFAYLGTLATVYYALHVWLAALLTIKLVTLIHLTNQPDRGRLLGDPVYLLCHRP